MENLKNPNSYQKYAKDNAKQQSQAEKHEKDGQQFPSYKKKHSNKKPTENPFASKYHP